MDLIELRRLGSLGNWEEDCGSISVAEKERLREGERKELGERLERRWVGEG
jgi:hypothetical protein